MSRTLNLCIQPPWHLASLAYNDNPEEIEIQGVRQGNRFLFQKLDEVDHWEERAHIFHDYMSVKFHLHEWETEQSGSARKSLRNSYLRFLRGWGVDSNSIEAAVLKGWVESRIGFEPTFHRGRLMSDDPDELMAYVTDRMKGSQRTNAINSQLDLLFEFCQYELRRRFPERRWFSLYRGTYDSDQYETALFDGEKEAAVRMNSLSSFTSQVERAWEFGSTVWEAQVPRTKILFFSALLPGSILKGEDEYLVIGGAYRVRKVRS